MCPNSASVSVASWTSLNLCDVVQESEYRERDRDRHRREPVPDRHREPDRPAVSPRNADLAASQQRPAAKRISHEEMEVSP